MIIFKTKFIPANDNIFKPIFDFQKFSSDWAEFWTEIDEAVLWDCSNNIKTEDIW